VQYHLVTERWGSVFVDGSILNDAYGYMEEKRDEYSIREADSIWLDAGGAICVDESKVFFEANGIRFGAGPRHLPLFLQKIANAREHHTLTNCVFFFGEPDKYLISKKTQSALLIEIEKAIQNNKAEIDQVERKLEKAFPVRGILCPFCGSEKPYTECCGKPSETN